MFPEGRILDFLIVGAVALIVVGPKDLPILMRKVGQFLARMRSMAAEFRASFDELARQSELDELRREVEAMRAGRPLEAAVTGDKEGHARQVLDEINTSLAEGHVQLHPPMGYERSATPAITEPSVATAAPDDATAPPVKRRPSRRRTRATASGKADA